MQKGAAQEVQICPGRCIICITGFKTDIFAQVPKCGNVPYQKCEEGYEDKCKETPKKVKTFCVIFSTRNLGARWALISSWWPPATLLALRACLTLSFTPGIDESQKSKFESRKRNFKF